MHQIDEYFVLVSRPPKSVTSPRHNPHTCCQGNSYHIPRIHLAHLPYIPMKMSPSICKNVSPSLFPLSLSATTLPFNLSLNLTQNSLAGCGLSEAA